jgi:hypothetical protein
MAALVVLVDFVTTVAFFKWMDESSGIGERGPRMYPSVVVIVEEALEWDRGTEVADYVVLPSSFRGLVN